MILRRITEHVKAQNWTAVALDFVIVVTGVFIGIQVANWNDERQTWREAAAYHERLLADLRAEAELFRWHVEYYGTVRAHAERVTAALQRPQEALGADFLVDAYQASQVVAFTPIRGTYEELLAIGAIDTLPDIETRDRLNAHYRTAASRATEWALRTPYRDTVRGAIPDAVQQEIHDACEVVGAGIASLETGCEPDLAPGEVEAAIGRLSAVPDLWVQSNRNLADLRVKILLFDAQIRETEALIAYFEDETP